MISIMILKTKFNQWWSTIPQISTKRTITSHWTQKKRDNNDTWRWKSVSWLGTGI